MDLVEDVKKLGGGAHVFSSRHVSGERKCRYLVVRNGFRCSGGHVMWAVSVCRVGPTHWCSGDLEVSFARLG